MFEDFTKAKFTKKILPEATGFWVITSTVEPTNCITCSKINYIDGLGYNSDNGFVGKDRIGTILDAEISGEHLIVVSPNEITSYNQSLTKTTLKSATDGEYYKFIAKDTKGILWILSNKAIFNLEGELIKLPRDIYCSDFEVNQDKAFWLASNDTVFRIDQTRMAKYQLKDITGKDSTSGIFSLRIDKNNAVWINTSNKVFQLKQENWDKASVGSYQGENFKTIPFMDIDSKGNIWLAERNYQQYTNLHCFDGSSWKSYKLTPPLETWINDIEAAEDGYAWLATYTGLIKVPLIL